MLGVIAISWWLVLLPFYLGIAVILAILVIGGVAGGAMFGIGRMYRAFGGRTRASR